MKKLLDSWVQPTLVLLISQALLSLIYWFILLYMVGLPVSFLQVYGVSIILNMVVNLITNKARS